jgi:flagellar basal body rod protein FlgC
MAYTTVAELRSALGVGTLYQDSVLQSVCDAADNVLIPFLWTNSTPVIGHSNTTNTGTSFFQDRIDDVFYVGQSLVFSGCGSKHNGNKTLTGVGEYSVTYAITGNSNVAAPYHPINPYGSAAADTYVDYSTVPSVQEASLMIAIAIWQARQAPSGQGMSVDGFTPSPFTMSSTLVARIRGLIAPYLSPNSQVG